MTPTNPDLINYWVYILLCENDTYYTGYTNDLKARYRTHINGTGRCKYTRSFRPLTIAQCWKITGNKSLAMKTEKQIKNMSRQQKKELVLKPSILASNPDIKCISQSAILKIIKNASDLLP